MQRFAGLLAGDAAFRVPVTQADWSTDSVLAMDFIDSQPIEALIPDVPGPDPARMLDIHMLALVGGRQRTANEYAYLLRSAGFELLRTVDTHGGVSILEAVAR